MNADGHEEFRLSRAAPEDLAEIQAAGAASPWVTKIIEPQFGRLGALFRLVAEGPDFGGVRLCRDVNGALLGWACAIRFHPRAGYAGTVQFLWDLPLSDLEKTWPDALFANCRMAIEANDAERVVAYAHSSFAGAFAWFSRNGFKLCGELPIGADGGVQVFLRGAPGP